MSTGECTGPLFLTPEKQKLLLGNLQEAYKVLAAYFGEELMTAEQAMEVPIRFQSSKGKDGENAKIVWKNYADTRDRCNIVKTEPHELVVQTFSVDVLAHELFHLNRL